MAVSALACAPKNDKANPPDDVAPVACTEEAMECPDGSAVGREGPNCEFAACPGDELSEEAAAGAEPEADAAAADPTEPTDEPTEEASQ